MNARRLEPRGHPAAGTHSPVDRAATPERAVAKRKRRLRGGVSRHTRTSARPHGSQEQRSKAVTQQRILNAALSLFVERGYDRADVRTIASRAGVSHSAVFWHFGSKQRLFQEASRLLLRPFLDQLATSLRQDDPHKRLFDLFAVYEYFVFENRDTIRNIVRWLLESHRLRASLERELLALHESFAGDVRETLLQLVDDPGEAAELTAALVSLLHGNLLLSFIDPSSAARELRRAGVRTLAEILLKSPVAAVSARERGGRGRSE